MEKFEKSFASKIGNTDAVNQRSAQTLGSYSFKDALAFHIKITDVGPNLV